MNAPTRAEFLARRQAGIGGSDISVLLGVNPWRTPYELWLDKTGRAIDSAYDPDREERLHFGNVLEEVVAREDAERGGYRIQRINQQIVSPEWPIAIANIDRAIVSPGSRARWSDSAGRLLGVDGILECKTAHALAAHSAEWGDSGTDEVPEHYWLQVQWYLGVTGVEIGRLAVLFGGQKLRRYVIKHDPAIYSDLLDTARGWWERHIVADTPPAPSSEKEARIAYRRERAGKTIEVAPAVADLVEDLAQIKTAIADLQADEKKARDALTCAIGDAEAITYAGQTLATWKSNKDSTAVDWAGAMKTTREWLAVLAQNGSTQAASILEDVDGFVSAALKTTPGARVLRLKTPKQESSK